MERLIISAELKDRTAWDIVNLVNQEGLLSTQAKMLQDEIDHFYKTDTEADHVDLDIINARLSRKYPKHPELIGIIGDCDADNVSSINIKQELIDLALERIADRLSLAFSLRKTEEIEIYLPLYHEIQEKGFESIIPHNSGDAYDYTVYNDVDLEGLLKETDVENKIKLFPESLNDHLSGGIYRKQHCVIFGRPDCGKTTFLVNLVYGFLEQGLKVLFIENEDPGSVLYKRVITRFTGIPTNELSSANSEQYRFKNISNFTLIETESGTLKGISDELEKISADVLIVDQLRNLHTKSDTRVTELEAIARGLREIAKHYDIAVFSVTQAGDSGEGKPILGMGDVDWSNTAIQGACDLLIGIGVNDNLFNAGVRVCSFPKNKINGNKLPLQLGFNLPLARVEG